MSSLSQVFNGQNVLAASLQAVLPAGVSLSNQAIGTVIYLDEKTTVGETDIFDAGLDRVIEDGRPHPQRIPTPGVGWWQLKTIQFTAFRIGGLLNVDSAIRFKVFGWRREQFEHLLPDTVPGGDELPTLFDGSIGEYDSDEDTANDRWKGINPNNGLPDNDWAYWDLNTTPRLFTLPGVAPGARNQLQGYFSFPPELMSYSPDPVTPFTPHVSTPTMHSFFSIHAVMPVTVSQVRLIFFFDRPI